MYDSNTPTKKRRNTFGIGAAKPWAAGRTDCSSVYIGIVDEGYQHTHPDLVANAGGLAYRGPVTWNCCL